MGLLGGLIGPAAPGLTSVPLDKGTQKIISDQYGHATAPTSQLVGEANAGVDQAGQNFSQPPVQQSNAQFGGTGFSDAIRNQYNKVAGKSIYNVKSNNENMESMKRAHSLQQASQSMMAQSQVETTNYEAQMQAMMQADAARAQTLSSVLGLAGMGAGMYAANGGFKSSSKTTNKNPSTPSGQSGLDSSSGFDDKFM